MGELFGDPTVRRGFHSHGGRLKYKRPTAAQVQSALGRWPAEPMRKVAKSMRLGQYQLRKAVRAALGEEKYAEAVRQQRVKSHYEETKKGYPEVEPLDAAWMAGMFERSSMKLVRASSDGFARPLWKSRLRQRALCERMRSVLGTGSIVDLSGGGHSIEVSGFAACERLLQVITPYLTNPASALAAWDNFMERANASSNC